MKKLFVMAFISFCAGKLREGIRYAINLCFDPCLIEREHSFATPAISGIRGHQIKE